MKLSVFLKGTIIQVTMLYVEQGFVLHEKDLLFQKLVSRLYDWAELENPALVLLKISPCVCPTIATGVYNPQRTQIIGSDHLLHSSTPAHIGQSCIAAFSKSGTEEKTSLCPPHFPLSHPLLFCH